MQASAGYIIPGDGFLAGIRELCDEFGFLLTDDEIAASWGPGAHVGTFSASALASAAANATLNVYESEQLVDRAFEVGGYFADQLRVLQERHPILGWIDARGLFVGLEFVKDRAAKEPAAEEASWMLDFCVREGLPSTSWAAR
jgi:4-aminobutyrate aminotransferase-like enzyme